MLRSYTGIDEAALGPFLGPYCCSAVTFEVEGEEELYDRFSSFSHLKIGDSKQLYKAGKGLEELEKTSLSFLKVLTGVIPETLEDLLSMVIADKQTIAEIQSIPWYQSLKDFQLPQDNGLETINKTSEDLKTFMNNRGIAVKSIDSDVVTARRFNKYLQDYNKSESCQQILSPLITRSLKENSRLVIDRQGGRRYYGEWLLNLFPGQPLSIRKELKDLSVYDVGSASIHFQVKGDDLYLETSLASIISKYLRELMMEAFNSYWQRKAPGIKKTAGYPQDARRFIRELDSQKIPYDGSVLIRKK